MILFEKDDAVAKQAYRANRLHLTKLLGKYKIRTFLNSEIVRCKDGVAICRNLKTKEERQIEFNQIAVCVGM